MINFLYLWAWVTLANYANRYNLGEPWRAFCEDLHALLKGLARR